MRILLFYISFLLFVSVSGQIGAQSSMPIKQKESANIFSDNRYGPFHQTIKDTLHKTISDIGCYFSAGFGVGNIYGIGAPASMFSATLAGKSFLITLSGGSASSLMFLGGANGSSYYTSNYFGLLLGESMRVKYGMFSISAGVASTNLTITKDVAGNFVVQKDLSRVISIPVELKFFGLARNGFGYGIHISKNFLSPSQFSPFYFGVCLVGGYWNKPKK